MNTTGTLSFVEYFNPKQSISSSTALVAPFRANDTLSGLALTMTFAFVTSAKIWRASGNKRSRLRASDTCAGVGVCVIIKWKARRLHVIFDQFDWTIWGSVIAIDQRYSQEFRRWFHKRWSFKRRCKHLKRFMSRQNIICQWFSERIERTSVLDLVTNRSIINAMLQFSETSDNWASRKSCLLVQMSDFFHSTPLEKIPPWAIESRCPERYESENSLFLNLGLHVVTQSMWSPTPSDYDRINSLQLSPALFGLGRVRCNKSFYL